jgi:hypothetical protein
MKVTESKIVKETENIMHPCIVYHELALVIRISNENADFYIALGRNCVHIMAESEQSSPALSMSKERELTLSKSQRK